jgi:HAD superfamily hydrolase (TIGR01509 family)
MKKTILVDAWNTLVTENGIFKELKKMLDEFPNRKIILTNANKEELIKYGIVNMPYEVFSLQHNPNKTDPEFYKRMLKHFSLTPKDVLYFEHNEEAVKSATSAGIKAFHYDKNAKDVAAVRTFLKKNI